MRNRFGFAYNNLGICPLFIWRTMVSLTLTELLRFLICSLTNLISFEKTVVIQACTKTRNSDTKRPKRNKRNYRNDQTKRSKRNDRNSFFSVATVVSFLSFCFGRFGGFACFVCFVSVFSFHCFGFFSMPIFHRRQIQY